MLRKYFFIFTLNLTILLNVNGQKSPLKIYGTQPINDSTCMKSTEVTIKEWVEFIVNNQFEQTLFPIKSGLSETASLIFDNLKNEKGKKYFSFNKQSTYLYNYFPIISAKPTSELKALFKLDTTEFDLNIPITGIEFEQAVKFCEWKENILNRRQSVKIKLSLPTIENYKYVIPNKDSLNEKKCALYNWAFCNCATEVKKNKLAKIQGKSLLRVDSYWPSLLGLYNLQGNASEMTSTKGIAIGGSFRQVARESYNDKIQVYKNPEDWLGFRYIVTKK